MADPSRHPFVRVRVPAGQLEMVELELWELGANGLEERDSTTIERGPAGAESVVLAAFADEAAAHRALVAMRGKYDADLVYVDGRNWAVEWRRGFRSQRIGARLFLRPSWEPVDGGPDDVVVTIDPENAFGSGDHETTRLVLRALESRIAGGERVLDVGCGSGVLSIAALKLGASAANAIDIESDVIATARRNALLNGVERLRASTRPLAEIDEKYEIVLANIETRVLVPMADALCARVAPGGFLIVSGVLRSERDELLAAFSSMTADETLEEGEWYAFVLVPEAA